MLSKFSKQIFLHVDLIVHSITWYMVEYCMLSKFSKQYF